jgi:ribonucleoside-triphosphate reductase
MLPRTQDGESGFQFCNLTETNGAKCGDLVTFTRACRAGAILGTLQAGYTNFRYVTDATRKITEHEALIGVSITGWMNNPDFLFDQEIQRYGAKLVRDVNKEVAALLGINQAARTTCAKPSGNASVILGSASGIHGEHSPRYFRNVQMNENDSVLAIIREQVPKMVETSVWSANGTDSVVSFPIYTKEGSVYKNDLLGVKQLEFVKNAQQNWVEHGTNLELCVSPHIRHNISNTISVDDWDEVEEYLYNNRQWFAGVSLLSSMGDKAYAQAPFTEVKTADQIFDEYGAASLLASGLIVDGLHAFNNDLWQACSTLLGYGLDLDDSSEHLLKRDWIRRANKFSNNFFGGDTLKTTFCLKDCFNLHKWISIERDIKPIDFAAVLSKQQYTDADTLGSQGCAGGACEVSF